MFDDTMIPAITLISYNRRILIVTIFLAAMAFLLVATSIAAFVYVTRKEKILRKCHLVSVITIILVELAFLVAVVGCCSIQSRNTQGQILAVLLIIISFFALMALIYFLLEDILRERIEPICTPGMPSKSHTIQEIRTISQHGSPIPPTQADEAAIPIPTPRVLTPVPRLPTPPLPPVSPPPEKPTSPSPELPPPAPPPPGTPPEPEKPPSPRTPTPPSPPSPSPPPPPPPSNISHFEKIRRELLAAIEERTIPALESAIQEVKDHDVIQQLKYECERALELLNRLMKIEHMKRSRVPWKRIRVLRLNQSTIAELHSYVKPPDEVSTVMRATFLLLGHAEREIQEWPQIQNLLGRFGKDSVRRRCYELNPLAIPVDKAREAKDILRNYDLIRVSEISVGLSAFYCWATTMIEEREKLLESQRRIVR